MKRRERLERKLEKRQEWASNAAARSNQRYESARQATEGIPFGQPILIGHHSEKRHRNALKRQDNHMRKSCEESDKAKHHQGKAHGLADQLDRTIFSDDDDAIQQLEEKVKGLEAERDRAKITNAAWRKAGKPKADNALGWAKIAAILGVEPESFTDLRLAQARDGCGRSPYPPYVGQNLSGNIKRCKDRIAQIKYKNEKAAKAEQAGGVMLEHQTVMGKEWTIVTFAEKPEYSLIKILKAAGFYWGSGSWHGYSENLPEEVKKLV